jgi:DNA modification methylase
MNPKFSCQDAREFVKSLPSDALLVSDPPYNQGYHYSQYRDRLEMDEYASLLRDTFAGRKAVIILYPEEAMTVLPFLGIGELRQVVSWVYNSNTAKQHRLVTWWNCEPDFRKIPQAYKNPTDRRIAARIAQGKSARGYDWWQVNQVKNVSKKHSHPCPIPDEVARRIIASTAAPGQVVADPFCGSGTVPRVASELGFLGVGCDIDAAYIAEASSYETVIQMP